MKINKIYNESCFETMSRMPNDFVDMVFTSPPYNSNLRVMNGKHVKRTINDNTSVSNKYGENFRDDLTMNDYFHFLKNVIEESMRVCKNYVFINLQILTGNKKAIFDIIGLYSENILEFIIWDKQTSEPAMNTGCLNSQFEIVLVIKKGCQIGRKFEHHNFKRGELSNVVRCKKNYKKINGHSAVMPEKFAGFFILNFSIKDDLIYDPFGGTGTTAIVSNRYNRNFILIEISKEYYILAQKRVKNQTSQFRLF